MTSNEPSASETEAERNSSSINHPIEKQRTAVLDELEGLLEAIEEQTGRPIDRVRQNLTIARANPLADGEYDYCVRLALRQLDRVVAKSDGDTATLRAEIADMREELPAAAALPPHDQLTRTNNTQNP